MKVAYVITLPDLGGAQSHVYELMKNMRAMYQVIPVLVTGKKGWLTEQAQHLGIETYIIPDMVREISPTHDWKANRELQNLFRKIHPDLIHCHSSKAGILGRWAARQCGIPSVFTAHGWAFTDGVPEIKRKIYRLIEKIAGKWCKKIICVSEYDRNLALREIPQLKDKLVTVHNCIPDTIFQKKWNQFNDTKEKTLEIVTVARFSPPKKILETLDVVNNAVHQGIKLHLTFIGNGPLFDQAVSQANAIGIENHVTFLGARTDVEKLLPNYDLFLLLTNWEGFPISIIEAMRAGLPVMASDVGGVSESVESKIGWLIPSHTENVVHEIQQISAHKDILVKKGIAAREKYLNHFTVYKMIKEIYRVYQTL